jgi:hypothetical protein
MAWSHVYSIISTKEEAKAFAGFEKHFADGDTDYGSI